MTLQEVRKLLNDPNLSIECNILCKPTNEKNNITFNEINCSFTINTTADLKEKKVTYTHLVTDEVIKMKGFEDITDYFLNTEEINKIRLNILEVITEHYKFYKKK